MPSEPLSDSAVELPIVASSLIEDPASQRDAAVDVLRSALGEIGAFVLRVEGAGPEVDAATRQWRRFYSLPEATKRSCQATRDEESGWLRLRDEPVYNSHLSATERDALRCKEQFGCSSTQGAGAWPSEDACPGFRRDISACARLLCGSARSLLSTFEALLEQDPGFLRYESGYLTLTTYPGSPFEDEDEAAGVGLHEHSDAVVFTMLRQTVAALEIKTIRGEWLRAPVLRDDSFLVIPGDWMELLTNGVIPAVRHRVREVESDRESVAFFQNVAPMPVGPLEHFVRDGAPVRYPTVSSAIPYAGGDSGVPRWKTHARPVTASSPGE